MPSNALKIIQNAQNRSFIYGFMISYASVIIIVSIVALIIGAVFYGQCAIEPNIPIFLIVEGITVALLYSFMLGMVSKLLNSIAIISP